VAVLILSKTLSMFNTLEVGTGWDAGPIAEVELRFKKPGVCEAIRLVVNATKLEVPFRRFTK
jgi:hypothetical protein